MDTPAEIVADGPPAHGGERAAGPRHEGKAGRAGGVAKNSLWNLIGQGLPILLSIWIIPRLIHQLGVDRFGILTLAWMSIGYLSLFDLGLGRALTKQVAEMLGTDREGEIPPIAWTALGLMAALSLFGALLAVAIAHPLAYKALKVPAALRSETFCAFLLLAAAIPSVVITSGLRGILEAKRAFGVVNGIRICLGVFMFVGPYVACLFVKSLVVAMALLVAARLVVMFVHLYYCMRILPGMRAMPAWRFTAVRPLLSFGAMMTVSNIISPIMVSMDRFLIGSQISSRAIAYYATPLDTITRLWIIPSSVVGAMFPVFSALYYSNKAVAAALFERSARYISLVLFPACLIAIVFARVILGRWLGEAFAQNGAVVLQWISVGVFVNGLGQVSFSAVQGAGRADITTRLHLAELPCYLFAVWLLMSRFGVAGVAFAWTLRTTVDTVLLTHNCERLLEHATRAHNVVAGLTLWLLLSFGLAALRPPLAALVGYGIASLMIYAFFAYTRLIAPEERDWLAGRLLRQLARLQGRRWQSL